MYAALLLTAVSLLEPPPLLTNAALTTRTAPTPLAATLSAESKEPVPRWLVWAVPAAGRRNQSCCFDGLPDAGSGSGCRLEGTETFFDGRRREDRVTAKHVYVFVRLVAGGSVGKIRVYGADCPLDAGGRPVVFLAAVDPDESVRWLAGRAGDSDRDALVALAAHDGEPALAALLTLAKRNPESAVRSHALFWLAHRAGEKSIAALTDAIEDDPETEVKTAAVFGLSQLPKDDGIPRLIAVARTHRNPEVRSRAFFWLGQSRDARAFAFIEEVVSR